MYTKYEIVYKYIQVWGGYMISM